jgi:hypothetical protein
LPEQALEFADRERHVHKRFSAHVIPTRKTVAVDQKRAVQRDLFEVVVGAVRLEDL